MIILRHFAEQSAVQQNHSKLRVLVDSNVWVSGIVFGGISQKCIELAYGHYSVVMTEDILSEITYVLKAKFAPSYKLLRALRIELDSIYIDTERPKIVIRDPKDEHIIIAALELGAGIIVTGDKDILTFDHPDILVVTPAEFLDLK